MIQFMNNQFVRPKKKKKKLSKEKKEVLEKGMKFIPIPQKCNKNEFTEDLSEFSRKVRLLEYFEFRRLWG